MLLKGAVISHVDAERKSSAIQCAFKSSRELVTAANGQM